MEKLLKGVSLLIALSAMSGIVACSNSSTNQGDQGSTTTQNNTLTNASPSSKSNCNRPVDAFITVADYQDKGVYQLTYAWTSVNNATGYEFEFLINGTTAFQNSAVTDTFITFTQSFAYPDSLKVAVRTVCGANKSPTVKESQNMVYNNAISVDDIVFLVNPSTNVNDICSRNCQKLKFTSNTMLNADGSTITINSFGSQVYYYDFNAIKSCIQCTNGGTAPQVDPTAFNQCLSNPLNQYWLYDPGAYTACP